MDTYGEIIVKLDRIFMILPHFFFFPMSRPPEGGVVDAAVYARPSPQDAAARSRSKKAVRSPPSSPTKASRKKI